MTLEEIVRQRDPLLWLLWSVSQGIEESKSMLQQLLQGQAKEMSALDDLAAATDEAVAAMNHAAETIQQHAGDNPAMAAAAARLRTAASALEDIDPAEAAPPAADTGGGATAP